MVGMIKINQRAFLLKLLWFVNSAAKYNQSGGREAIPKYCHFDQNNFPSGVTAPDSKMDAKLHVQSEIIKMEKGTLPGLERRRQVIAAVMNDSNEAMAYIKAKSGKSYRMGSYPSIYFVQIHITPIIYFTQKSANLILFGISAKIHSFYSKMKNRRESARKFGNFRTTAAGLLGMIQRTIRFSQERIDRTTMIWKNSYPY